MSHYKPYPTYKDSGVEWLGMVPEHWTIGPYKATIQIENGSDYKEVEADDGYPVIGSGGPFAYSSKLMYDGESVLLGRKGTIDRPLYVNGAFWAVDTMYWSIIKPGAHGRFAYYIATTIPFDMYSTNTALPSMTKSVLGSHVVAFPGIEEQQTIAGHLDRETARIDALIEKKTRFIELLREKRQALITHAVTKGLAPNVKMKDSGVEWLGEVPEHWVVSRLRHNIDGPLSYGANEAAESDEPNDPRFIRITDLHEDGTLREDTFKSLPWNVAQPYLLSDGDVLLARSGATVGKSFIYRESMGPSCYAGYLIRARLLPSKLISQYFWLCTQSIYYWDFIAGSNIQATIQNVSGEKYANLWLAVPPIKEQQRIINFLEEACDRLDAVRVKTERSIELLKERRSALITAAVTGQIDLREAV